MKDRTRTKDDLIQEVKTLNQRLAHALGRTRLLDHGEDAIITDRKRFEEALRQSEERHRKWFEDDLTGDYILSPKGEILECNPAFMRIFGFSSKQEAIGSDVSTTFLDPTEWKTFRLLLRRKGKLERYECTRIRREGAVIDVIENAVGAFDDHGRLVEVKCYAFDNTERKRAERALRESEERYRRLFQDDLTGDCLAQPDGTILDCNPAFVEIFGFSSEEEARSCGLASTYPDQSGWDEFVGVVAECGKLEHRECNRVRRDGMMIHVVENAVGSFDKEGRLVEVKCYAFDDSERKRAEQALRAAEERYRSLVELVPDAIWVSDAETVWFANPAAAQLLGAESPGELVGRSLRDFFHPSDYPGAVERTDLALREGQPQPLARRKVVRLDGQTVDVETTVAPCAFEGRTAVIRVSRDITERIKAEDALQKKDREISLHAEKVEKLNTALQVLLDQRQQELTQKEENIRATLEKLVFPFLESLKGTRLDDEQKTYVEVLETNLNNISSPFARRLATWHERLTPTEIQVADLLIAGKKTKEIARLLGVSPSAVAFHRANIRSKLGLKRKGTNLVSFLRYMNKT